MTIFKAQLCKGVYFSGNKTMVDITINRLSIYFALFTDFYDNVKSI